MKAVFSETIKIAKGICNFNGFINRRKLVTSFYNNKKYLKNYPSIIYIETTNICNISCVMCPTQNMNRPKSSMSFELYENIINQLNPKVTELIVLHSDGEPLINKDQPEMIKYAKERGFNVLMSTNATLLNKNVAERVVDSGLDVITISLDGMSKKVYEKIRRGSNFEKVMDNIDYFLKVKGNKTPLVNMQMVSMKENLAEVDQFKQRWGKRLRQRIVHNVKPAIEWFKEKEQIKKRKSCDRPWFGMVIESNGNVVPCVHDYDGRYPIGNVKDTHIYKIWNSKKMLELREAILTGRENHELCKDCNYESPLKHSFKIKTALTIFDMVSVQKILSITGYSRKRQR